MEAEWPAPDSPLVLKAESVDDELRSSDILDLKQHPDGRLWVLHRLGVEVFDGWRSEVPGVGLEPSRLGALEIDSRGRVWAVLGWGYPAVFLLQAGRWQPLPELPRQDFSDAPVFLSVLEASASTWSQGEGSSVTESLVVLATTDGRIWTWRVDAAGSASAPESLATPKEMGSIHAVTRFDHRLAVASDSGLLFLDLQGRISSARDEGLFQMPMGPIYGLTTESSAAGPSDGAGSTSTPALWLLTARAVAAGDTPTRQVLPQVTLLRMRKVSSSESQVEVVARPRLSDPLELQPRQASDFTLSMAVGPVGDVYFGNASALHRWTPGQDRARKLDRGDSFSDARLPVVGTTALLADREGGVWVGGRQGLSRLTGKPFLTLDRDRGLLEDEVTAMLQLGPETFVFAHRRGLSFMEAGVPSVLPLMPDAAADRSAYRVLNMALGADGDIWLATLGAGLLRVDAERQVRRMDEPEAPRAFAYDGDGRLWLASAAGLSVEQDRRFTFRYGIGGTDYVRGLMIDDQGDALVATVEGLLIHRQGGWHRALSQEASRSNLFSVTQLRSGEIWLGSLSGLSRLSGTRLEPIPQLPDLNVPIYFMFQDADQRVWLGSHDGVRIWDGQELRHLGIRHGLAGNETNRGAGYLDQTGRAWIGTDQGVSLYRGIYDRPETPPSLRLLSVEVNGRPTPLDQPLKLTHEENSLVFQFRMVSMALDAPLRVRYFLDGWDQEFVQPQSEVPTEVRYSSLPPGSYRFTLEAGWGEDRWGQPQSSAWITIEEPLWRRSGFRVGAVAIMLAALLIAFRLRVRAIRRHSQELGGINRRLRRSARERERLIEDLAAQNRQLATHCYTFSHDLKTPLVNIRGFAGFARQAVEREELTQALVDLEQIDRSAERMTLLLQDLLRLAEIRKSTLMPSKVYWSDVVKGVLGDMADRLREANALVEVEPSVEMPAVWGDASCLHLLLHQLVDNALKFNESPQPRLVLSGVERAQWILLRVADNGIGIETGQLKNIFGLFKRLSQATPGTGAGLALVDRVAGVHGGRAWGESDGLGEGACFVVALPKAPDGDVNEEHPS